MKKVNKVKEVKARVREGENRSVREGVESEYWEMSCERVRNEE